MARSYTYPIIGALLFAALLAIQLVQSFSLPRFDLASLVGYHHLEHGSAAVEEQKVLFSDDEELKRASTATGSKYLLGVGKADITG